MVGNARIATGKPAGDNNLSRGVCGRCMRRTKVSHAVVVVTLLILSALIAWVDYRGNRRLDTLRARGLRLFSTAAGSVHTMYTHMASGKEESCIPLTEQLEEAVGRANAIGLYMQSVMRENDMLKQLLHYHANDGAYGGASYVTTKVAGQFLSASSGFLFLSVGSEHGVRTGQAVINRMGLVGRIIDVSDHSSEVMLVTNPRFRTPVIMRDSNERAMFSGSTLDLTLPNKNQRYRMVKWP